MEQFVNKEEEFKEGIRFPIWIKESGINYVGINKSLNKPHGLVAIMRTIIKLTMNKSVRFETLTKKLLGKYQICEIEDALEILKRDGIIQTISKNANPRKGEYFSLNKICLDPRAEADLKNEGDSNTEAKLPQLRIEVESILRSSNHRLAVHLINCIDKGVLSDINGNAVVETKAWISFRSVALVLAYSVTLQERGKYETLREISIKIWGSSKKLDRYKYEITKVSGMSLLKLNINIMPEVTYVYGDFNGIVNNLVLSASSGYPVVLADSTISNLNIIEVKARNILIVENSAVFLAIFNKKYINSSDTILIWGEGYLSSSKKELLKKILKFNPLPVYIWSDIDGDGLELTLDIINFVKKLGTKGQPILMGENELKLSSGQFKGADHINLNRKELQIVFPDVINLIKEGNTMEQEELLLHYEQIESKLP